VKPVRLLTAAVPALACMGVVVAGTAAPALSQPVESQSVEKLTAHGKYQRQAHNTTNKRREAHGLKELRRTDCVQRFAVRQAKRMAQQEQMFHQQLGPIVEECGLRAVGENVAYGYPTGRSVVNDGWMKSPGHRANILNPDFRLMGIGARKGHDGRWYVAQVLGRKA
jgi:uncharacterized protein YkwD